MVRRVWELRPVDPGAAACLARELGISPLLAALLLRRGVADPDSARRFLNPQLSDLHDPFLLSGMERAVERVCLAVQRGEKVLLYGDYDVDGITSVVILKQCLQDAGARVDYHVPERLLEGYGLRPERIRAAAREDVKLVISADSGIRGVDAAREAHACGIDLIVTDHHVPGRELPPAYEILNPNRPGCGYPEKNLAGVGVAFKLVQALLEKWGRRHQVGSYLKMVALGTVADVVPLEGENRVFAKFGLQALSTPPRSPGLRALLESAGLLGARVDCAAVGFRLAPRLNAVGRMGDTADAVRLFDAREDEEARRIAARLHDKNLLRKQEQEEILAEIERRASREPEVFEQPVIVLWDSNWHRGVIGIVAARVMEKYGRPAVIASVEGGTATGSGRSFGALHLLEALQACAGLLERFGGHHHAAGFTMRASQLPDLRRDLAAHVRGRGLQPVPTIVVDAVLPLREVDAETWSDLVRLEPFGAGNPVPVFLDEHLPVGSGPFLVKQRHLKWRLKAPHCAEAIWWNQGGRLEELRGATALRGLYQLQMDEFQGERRLMAHICDLQGADGGA